MPNARPRSRPRRPRSSTCRAGAQPSLDQERHRHRGRIAAVRRCRSNSNVPRTVSRKETDARRDLGSRSATGTPPRVRLRPAQPRRMAWQPDTHALWVAVNGGRTGQRPRADYMTRCSGRLLRLALQLLRRATSTSGPSRRGRTSLRRRSRPITRWDRTRPRWASPTAASPPAARFPQRHVRRPARLWNRKPRSVQGHLRALQGRRADGVPSTSSPALWRDNGDAWPSVGVALTRARSRRRRRRGEHVWRVTGR